MTPRVAPGVGIIHQTLVTGDQIYQVLKTDAMFTPSFPLVDAFEGYLWADLQVDQGGWWVDHELHVADGCEVGLVL
jgi:hypothetical protein